jgi:hypothetical protein
MKRKISHIILLTLFLTACAPAERTYCQRMGTPPGHIEYNNCVRYFYEMENWFARDREPCLAKAKETYPDYLYDRGRYGDIDYYGGYGYGSNHGGFPYGGASVRIPPDAWKNSQVDDLRLKIITPCMNAKGWNSGTSWDMGRARPPLKLPR